MMRNTGGLFCVFVVRRPVVRTHRKVEQNELVEQRGYGEKGADVDAVRYEQQHVTFVSQQFHYRAHEHVFQRRRVVPPPALRCLCVTWRHQWFGLHDCR